MKSRKKSLILVILVLLALIIVGMAWAGYDLYRFAKRPAGSDDQPIVVSIIPGQSFSRLATELKQKNVITHLLRFKILARLVGDDKRVKAGEYELTATMNPLEVLDTFVNGKVMLHKLTIPEGFNIDQIAAEVASAGLGDEDSFKKWVTDPVNVKSLDLQGPTMEGYLFPDTYFFPKGVSAQTIATKMVSHFNKTFTDQWRQHARELHFTVHEIVTLASIIEKETGAPAERPLIASVFHNRLKKKMRLESDPTVIYGIENFDGNITRRHLSTATPYNTYVIRGLPPGPIANPGLKAIEAALYPAKTDYLFFVSKKDGTHHFSSTIKEHNRAVRKYQLRRKKR